MSMATTLELRVSARRQESGELHALEQVVVDETDGEGEAAAAVPVSPTDAAKTCADVFSAPSVCFVRS